MAAERHSGRWKLIVCVFAACSALSACGDDPDSRTEPPLTVIAFNDDRAPTLQTGRRSCGAIEIHDGATDYPVNIAADGVDCRTARLIAREVTIDGASETPLGFSCPDALDNDDLQKRCVKGALEVRWDVHVE